MVEVCGAVDGDVLVQDCWDHQHNSMKGCCLSALVFTGQEQCAKWFLRHFAVQILVACVALAASALVGFSVVCCDGMDLKWSCQGLLCELWSRHVCRRVSAICEHTSRR